LLLTEASDFHIARVAYEKRQALDGLDIRRDIISTDSISPSNGLKIFSSPIKNGYAQSINLELCYIFYFLARMSF